MNDFKFNRKKQENDLLTYIDDLLQTKNDFVDDVDLLLSEQEAKKLINDFFAIHDKYDFFETEKLKQPNTNKSLIIENPDLSKLDNKILSEWNNKQLTGLDLLYFSKYLHAAIYSEFLGYRYNIDSTIKSKIAENITTIEKNVHKKSTVKAIESRQKKAAIWKKEVLTAWKSGKHDSKAKCAKSESLRLNISESSVREYLKTVKNYPQ